MINHPNYYTAYGLTIESEFDLPEIAADKKSEPTDIIIRRGSLEPVGKVNHRSKKRRIESNPDTCRLTYDSIGTFLIKDGKKIICDLDTDEIANKKIFRRIVENQLMAVLLLQRGLLVLHASAVVVNGAAVVFIGPRTAGKSTTAAAFNKAGYPVLGDDVIAIDCDTEVPTVVPGVPQIRLSPDAINGLGIGETTQPVGDWGPNKRYQNVDPVDSPVPLGTVYVLQDGGQLESSNLGGQKPFFQLTAHTYAQGLLSESAMTTTHFEQCSTVIETTPIRLLKRPREIDLLSDLVTLIAADMAPQKQKKP